MKTRFEQKRESQRLPIGIGYVTQRECQAIQLYGAGENASSAGPMMGIDYRTVETFMRNARNRTGARTNCQLVAMYVASNPVNARHKEWPQELPAQAQRR